MASSAAVVLAMLLAALVPTALARGMNSSDLAGWVNAYGLNGTNTTAGVPLAPTGPNRQFLVGMARNFGRGIADAAPQLLSNLSAITTTVLTPFSLTANFTNATVIPHQTPGLVAFDVVDTSFSMDVAGTQQTFPQQFTSTNAAIAIRIVQAQLQKVGFNNSVLLLYTRYLQGERTATSTIASAAVAGQDVYAQLEVRGRDLLPFTVDKQTLLLAALTTRFIDINAAVGSMNISAVEPLSAAAPGSRRLLKGSMDAVRVFMSYFLAPVPDFEPSATFDQVLGPRAETLRNLTSSLGLAMNVIYQNATLYTGTATGAAVTVTCDPPDSGCVSRFATTANPDSSGVSGGAIAGIIVGALCALVLAAAAAAAFALRSSRQRRVQGPDPPWARLDSGKASTATLGSFSKANSPGTSADNSGTLPSQRSGEAALVPRRQRGCSSVGSFWGFRLPWADQKQRAGVSNPAQTGSWRPQDLPSLALSAQDTPAAASASHTVGSYGSSGLSSGVDEGSTHGAALDADDEACSADIQICQRADGTPWVAGQGGFGTVYKALWLGHHEVAVKELTRGADELVLRALRREVRILRRISGNDSIVAFFAAVLDPVAPRLIMEWMPGGDLRHAIANDAEDAFAWDRRGRGVAIDIVRGMCFLHASGVVHRDIKSSNVLLASDGRAKLADVGLAKVVSNDYFSSTNTAGTFAYAAPELLLGHHCTEKVDIYSFGVVLWELVTKEQPVRGRMDDLAASGRCPPGVRDVYLACASIDTAARPTAPQLLNRLLDL